MPYEVTVTDYEQRFLDDCVDGVCLIGYINMCRFILNRGLLASVEYGYEENVKYLINKGADDNFRIGQPILLAIENGYPDLVKYFIERDVNILHDNYGKLLYISNKFHNKRIHRMIKYWKTF